MSIGRGKFSHAFLLIIVLSLFISEAVRTDSGTWMTERFPGRLDRFGQGPSIPSEERCMIFMTGEWIFIPGT